MNRLIGYAQDGLGLGGLVLVVIGVGLWSTAGALVVIGLSSLTIATVWARRTRSK